MQHNIRNNLETAQEWQIQMTQFKLYYFNFETGIVKEAVSENKKRKSKIQYLIVP